MRYALDELPMPPTVNQIYATNFQTGRRFKAKCYGDFLKMMDYWAMERTQLLNKINQDYSYFVNKAHRIKVHSFFAFPRSKINTCGDPSNRIKALHDSLKGLIKIDDRFFTVGNAENIITDEDPYAIIVMEPVVIVTDVNIREEVLGWKKTTSRNIL